MGEVFTVKGPTNWWRVAAMVAVPMFLYSTWHYAETAATLAHIREHLRLQQNAGQHAPAKPAPVAPSQTKP